MKLMFANLIDNLKYKNDNVFDWTNMDLNKVEFVYNELRKKKEK